MFHLQTMERTKGARLLLEADRLRRGTWWIRATGATASLFGALFQMGSSPALGGIILASGLMLLAIAEEVRQKAVSMSREARRAARRQIAESPARSDLVDYLHEFQRTRRAA
jgi:hypothetical protein